MGIQRLIVCIDPASLDLLHDFASDRSTTKMLEVQCNFSDEFLTGHATRVGLAGEQTPAETLERLLPTIRGDINFESDRIRDAEFDNLMILREGDQPEQHASLIARFLDISPDKALEVARSEHLFAD